MYSLTIDKNGADAIDFIGNRYAWSSVLQSLGYDTVGGHSIPEHHAWEISDAISSDMDGGHSAYPMLDPRSTLAESLTTLYQSIV
mgnify:CR=1